MSEVKELTLDQQRMARLRFLVQDTEIGNKYRKPMAGGGLVSVSLSDLRWLLERHDDLVRLLQETEDKADDAAFAGRTSD